MTVASKSKTTVTEKLDIIDFLRKNRKDGCSSEMLAVAAHEGEMEIVCWIMENIEGQDINLAIRWARSAGQTEVESMLYNKSNKKGFSFYTYNVPNERWKTPICCMPSKC